jgi:hypothetical protein
MWPIKKDAACPLPRPCISNCANRLPPSNHYIHMSVVIANVPSSTSLVTEPGRGDAPFQMDSSENRCAIPIQNAQAGTLSKHSDICILEYAPLKRNPDNRSERDEAGYSISELPSPGKRKERSSPLDEVLDDSSESSRADSPLPPRKVARISHALKRVTSPNKTSRESPLEASSSSMYSFPLSQLRVIRVAGIPVATSGGIFTNPFEAFLNPNKCVKLQL